MDINQLRKKLQGLLANGKQNAVYNLGQSNIGKGMVNFQKGAANVQRSIESSRSINPAPTIQPFKGNSFQSQVGNFGANLPGMVANGIASPLLNLGSDFAQTAGRTIGQQFGDRTMSAVPYQNLKSPITKLMYNAQGIQNKPQEVVGNIGQVGGDALNYVVPGVGKKLVTGAFNNGGKQALSTVFKKAAIDGAELGGAQAGLYGLSSGREGTLREQAVEGAMQAGFGALAGGALGGALGAGGQLTGKMFQTAKNVLMTKHGLSEKEASEKVIQLGRDRLGRFATKSPVDSPTPKGLFNNMTPLTPEPMKPSPLYSRARGKMYSRKDVRIDDEMTRDIRRALNIPDNLEGGFIKPGEFIPKKKAMKFKSSSDWQEVTPDVTVPIGGEFRMENGKQYARWAVPDNTKSVVDEIQKGFESGRQARNDSNGILKSGIGLKARSEFIDRLSPVYDLVKKGGKVAADDDPYKKMRLLSGTSGKVEAFLDKNIRPVLTKEKNRQADLSTLLVLDRERELITRGLTRKRSLVDIDQGMQELRSKYGDGDFTSLQESANTLRATGSQLLDQLKDSGIIDDQSYAVIKKNNEFYTPFEAVSHIADNLEKGHGTSSFNVASQDVVKKVGDYIGDVADPIESLVRKIPGVIALVEKNKAMQTLVNLRNQSDVYGDFIQPLKGEKAPQGMGIINVFENGNNVRYVVPEMVESAVKNLDAETGGILTKLGSIQAQMLRAGATGLNIGFIPVNIVRDVQDALTTEISENGVKAMLSFLASYPRAIYSAAGKGDLYQRWAAAGGLQSTMTEQLFKRTPQTVMQLSGKKPKVLTRLNPILNTKHLIEFANRVGEQSTRLARFNSGLSRGESMTEAAFKSRDISLDFAKSGNVTKVLNQTIPFLTASINGSEKLLRLYKTNPKAAIASTGVMFGIPTVALFTHNSQFQDYSDIPDAEKQTHWVILARDRTEEEIIAGDSPIGIKIPKGFMARMTSSTIENAMQFMKSQDPSTFAKSSLDTAAALSPIGLPYNEQQVGQTLSTILPPWIKAGTEWVSNTNLFFGSKIVPQSLENLPASEQYKEKTPGIYKLAGSVTGLSPLKIENTINSTTGGLGRQIATLVSGDLEGGTTKQISRRFSDIRDGKKTEEAYSMVNQEKQYTALRNKQLKEAFVSGNVQEFQRLSEGMSSQQIKSLINGVEAKAEKKTLTPQQRAYETLTKEERQRLSINRPELETKLDVIPQAGASGKSGFTSGTKDINTPIKKPNLTGNTELDKKLMSQYGGELTSRSNDIVDLYESGKLTAQEAEKYLASIKVMRSGSSKGRKGTKGRRLKLSITKFKLPKIKLMKANTKAFKIKPFKLAKAKKNTKLTLKPIKLS